MNTDDETLAFFSLYRSDDESGVSGTGTIAFGVKFPEPNGKVVAGWVTTPYNSVQVYDSMEELKNIHGHGGRTKVIQMDAIDVGGPS